MKIVLFVVDDLDFVPKLNRDLIENYGESIVQVYISKSLFGFKKLRKKLPFFIENRYPFCIKLADLTQFVLRKIKNQFGKQNNYKNIIEYFSSVGLKAAYVDNINNDEFRSELKKIDADVFLFSPFDKIAGIKFLEIPKLGAYNIHLGKLPDYKGGLSAFWILRFQDSIAGASMHKIIPKIDEGDVIEEIRFNVNTNSMYELMNETVQQASKMIIKGVKKIEAGIVEPINIEGRKHGYFLYPTRNDFKMFYKKMNKLI